MIGELYLIMKVISIKNLRILGNFLDLKRIRSRHRKFNKMIKFKIDVAKIFVNYGILQSLKHNSTIFIIKLTILLFFITK